MTFKTLFVTGGAGFIGSDFVAQAAHRGCKVIVLDALTYAGKKENLSWIHGDVTLVMGSINNQRLVEDLLHQHRPDAILHFAAESHVDNSIHSPHVFMETNVMGTMNLLQAARNYRDKALAPDHFRFLHVSTDEVYGDLPLNVPPADEDTPYAPSSPYAASKAASDHLVRAWHRTYGLPILLTNCTNNYGPRQLPEKLIPLCITNALAGKPLPIYGNGTALRDWIYVSDHNTGVWAALTHGTIGESYCLSGENELNTVQVVDALCAALDELKPRSDGVSYAAQKTFVPDRPGHDYRYALSSAKAQRDLGWKRSYSWEEGLRDTVAWFLKQ
jgi:dTDP-glucose 4,6-dehydratase